MEFQNPQMDFLYHFQIYCQKRFSIIFKYIVKEHIVHNETFKHHNVTIGLRVEIRNFDAPIKTSDNFLSPL